VRLEPAEGAVEAMIDRIVHLGFEVRVELTLADERKLWAQVTRARAAELELAAGQIVFVRLDGRSAFVAGQAGEPGGAGGSASAPGLAVAGELGD
jgi:sulfate transport system ATP-binding protein